MLSIGELVGYVTLNTTGLKAGAATATATMQGLGAGMDAHGIAAANGWVKGADGRFRNSAGKFVSSGQLAAAGLHDGVQSKMGGLASTFKQWGTTLGVLGAAGGAVAAVNLEAEFSKSMALIAASTGAPQDELGKMEALAKKLGKETSFSANDAADAMLELAKAGISTSDIMGGALAGTLTLAAAGGTDLATASTIASNAMNTFGLSGKDMDKVAAALAGGANASSASVESLGQALQQVGPGAKNAGMTLQETVGALSAFDAAGIKGADAGTALKTMLSALVPQTAKQKAAMDDLGLSFVNSDGSFKSMTQIAGQLHAKLGPLSEAQKTTALRTIFGADATRAATVLMNEGSKGIGKYIKATNDQDAAQKMAAANMSGTSGALEKMKGSLETAGLAAGQVLAPAVQKGASAIGATAEAIAGVLGWMGQHKTTTLIVAGVVGVLTAVVLAHNAAMALSAAGGMVQWLTQTKLISGATKVWTAVQWLFNAAMAANPLTLVVIGLVLLAGALFIAWSKSEKFREIVTGALDAVKNAGKAVGHWFSDTLPGFFADAWNGAKDKVTTIGGNVIGWIGDLPGKAQDKLSTLGDKIGGAFRDAMQAGKDKVTGIGGDIVGWIEGIPGKIAGLGVKFATAGRDLLQGFIDGMKNAAGVIEGIASNVWTGVKGLLNDAIDKINAALEFTIHLPGPDLHVDLPNIPHLATGGRATAATLAVIGEGREPESVLPDSVLRGLLDKAHAAGMAMAGAGNGGPLIGQVVQREGESTDELAERLWFKTRTRG